ncbi:MAG TPA: EAL domain-containing protein [Burkholderiaceae bacterium]|nr:EAL domain-containing protein [Burkholderiaceae bacterium]
MSSVVAPEDPEQARPWWARLHGVLLPDYNRKAAGYWWMVVLLGLATLAYALQSVATQPPSMWLQMAVGVGVATLAGVFPVRIPRSKNSFAAGEIFIFLLLLLHGPAAATLASAGEAAVGSWRTSKRWSSRIASPAMAALAMFASGSLLQGLLDGLQRNALTGEGLLIVAAMVFALAYFVLNTLLVTAVPRLKRNERLQWADLFGVFGWVGIAYAGSAAVAALLYLTYLHSGAGVLMAVVPIIVMLLATLHYFFRHHEVREAARQANAAAAEREAEVAKREAELAMRHMRELQDIAFRDSLTGLPNRRRFLEHLQQAVHQAHADRQFQFAVMYFDFDRFKLINDSLGHSAGDEFLIEVSRRIQANLRPGDIIARLGGDEFAILAQELAHERYTITLAERLLLALQDPILVAGNEVTTSASIGITFSRVGYATPEEVLRDADIAMYRAKAAGKARYALFDAGLHEEIARRLRLESDLRRALEAAQIRVAYQPMFNLATGKLAGFEALARWQHPEFGDIGPDVFIPIAEESGLIVLLTDLVLQRALHQLKQWQLLDASLADLKMQVNVSAKDIAHPGFVGRITHAIVEARLQPEHVTLELTENILMNQIESALPMLNELRHLGIGLTVDDFGTGYSSLSHLSSLPIDSLKVDRSFVCALRAGTKESTVVRAIVHLGNSLDKSVVAEGIETPSQLAQLREMGCELGQGFHLSRPLAPEQVRGLLDCLVAQPSLYSGPAFFERSALLH